MEAQGKTSELGIEILDVQFRRINYGESVRPDVYNRMISERRRIADRFRSEGQGEQANILGEMDRDLKLIQSEAYREAQTIIGDADAEATGIFADAYNQSADSRSFYEFLKTMETFRATVAKDTTLILSTEGELLSLPQGRHALVSCTSSSSHNSLALSRAAVVAPPSNIAQYAFVVAPWQHPK